MPSFILLAFPTDGGPALSGVAVRVFNASEQDVTALLTGGESPFYTTDGKYEHVFPDGTPPPLTPGVYTFKASAPGYETYSGPAQTSNTFDGFNVASVSLAPLPVGVDSTVSRDGSGYVSPMYPVEVVVDGQAPSAIWELIEATITNSRGRSATLEVDVVGGQARVNLQARLALDSTMRLVPDDKMGLVDPDFSDTFTTTFRSITPTGTFPLGGSLVVHVANAFPTRTTNDLTNFTNEEDVAEWLTPWGALPLPKFQGRYADAMIWLPSVDSGGYLLRTVFQNINRVKIAETTDYLENSLFESGRVARIRIPDAISGAYYAVLTIEQGTTTRTKPLNVAFIHA